MVKHIDSPESSAPKYTAEILQPSKKNVDAATRQVVEILRDIGQMEDAEGSDEERETAAEIADDLRNPNMQYIMLRNEQGENVGIGITELMRLKGKTKGKNNATLFVWLVGIGKKYRGTDAYGALIDTMQEEVTSFAEKRKMHIANVTAEAIRKGEALFSRQGLRGIYFETPDGSLVEMPYISPPGSATTVPDNPEDPAYKWLIRPMDGNTTLPLSDLEALCQGIYAEYCTEEDPTYNACIERTMELNRDIMRALGEHAVLASSKEVREKKKNNVPVIGPGEIRAWLKSNHPELSERYETIIQEISTMNGQISPDTK